MRTIIFTFGVLFPHLLLAQQTAFFETTLFFEDAIGNTDSIIVGFDADTNAEFNPEFGEADITEPWDSIFEIRAAHCKNFGSNFDPTLVLSKKIIGSNEGGLIPIHNCLYINEPIVIFANVKHLPLTVRWDNSVFSDSWCLNRSTLSTHDLPLSIGPWEIWYFDEWAENTACLAEDSIFVSDQLDSGLFGFFLLDEVEGMGQDTIQALLLNWRFEGAMESPCTATIVNTDELSNKSEINIYPNPTKSELLIEIETLKYWEVFNSNGFMLERDESRLINLSNYSSGIYYLRIFDGNNKYFVERIIKVEE